MKTLRFLLLLLPLTVAVGCGGTESTSGPIYKVKYPEEYQAQCYSRIFFARGKRAPAQVMDAAVKALRDMAGGVSFADEARSVSEDPYTAPEGGFIGFISRRPGEAPGPITGGYEAVPMGMTSCPVDTERGLVLLHRHPYEEGRRLERQFLIPVYGFFVASGSKPSDRYQKPADAEKAAQEAWKEVKDGKVRLGDVGQRYSSSQLQRPDAFFTVRDIGDQKRLYELLQRVTPGELAPLEKLDDHTWAICRRAKYIRCIARNIVVMYVNSMGRGLANITRSKEEAKARAEEVLAQLKPDFSNWSDLVKRYSDDPNAVWNDGTLGCVGNGDLIKELENALVDTPPGRVTDHVVDSPIGYHILWRVD